jgi:hypothetical protein
MKENKLIAEFWGMVLGDDGTMYYDDAENFFTPTPTDKLKFDTSWDWLIPVVEKCFQEDGKHYVINDALLTINIDEVHEAVVKFIKEYNKKS